MKPKAKARPPKKLVLGTVGRDCITGFRGVITARAEYLGAGPRVQLTPRVTRSEQAQHLEGVWFDESRVACILARNPLRLPEDKATEAEAMVAAK